MSRTHQTRVAAQATDLAAPEFAARDDAKQALEAASAAVDSALATVADLKARRDIASSEAATARRDADASCGDLANGIPEATDRFDELTRKAAAADARRDAFERKLLPAANAALIRAQEKEAHAVRALTYADAAAMTARASATLEAEYPALAERFLALLREVNEAAIAVDRANSDLPPGAEGLRTPEERVRDRLTGAREVLREQVVRCWVYSSSGELVPPDRVALIHTKTPETGYVATGGMLSHTSDVERRDFKKVEYLPAQQRARGERLATMQFPGLRVGEPDFWRSRSEQPATVLVTLAARQGEVPAASPRTELVPL